MIICGLGIRQPQFNTPDWQWCNNQRRLYSAVAWFKENQRTTKHHKAVVTCTEYSVKSCINAHSLAGGGKSCWASCSTATLLAMVSIVSHLETFEIHSTYPSRGWRMEKMNCCIQTNWHHVCSSHWLSHSLYPTSHSPRLARDMHALITSHR